MMTTAMFPSLSPVVQAIPTNPLRALYSFAARPGMLNLASGHPSYDAYDMDGLTEACGRALGDASAWSYGPSAGDRQLVAALEGLSPPRPDGHQLIVTSGAQQAVDLALRSLVPPGRAVAVPEPVYPAILSVCAAAGLRAVGYEVTDDPALSGLRRVLGRGDVAALYAQPTFSNPGGETWSLPLRQRVLALCATHAVPVVEDDPYRLLAFAGTPPDSLLTLSAAIEGSTVVWAGSLSKILAPGLRLGWAAVPGWLAGPMAELRQAGDLQPNALAQRVALRYLELDRLEAQLARIRALYQTRGERLAAALRGAGFSVTPAAGGMFLFPTLPPRAASAGLFERAVARGVLYAPGPAFALDPPAGRFAERLRLCFAGLDAQAIGTAAARLSAALEG